MKYVTPDESKYYIHLSYDKFKKADAFTTVSVDDKWEEVRYLANAILDSSGAVRPLEYVYVLVNRSVPGMVKIGMTTNTPDERARQISASTGVPTPWIPVFSFNCYRSDLLEEEVHEHLAPYRVNTHREMFSIDSITAQNIIEQLGYKYSTVVWANQLGKTKDKAK